MTNEDYFALATQLATGAITEEYIRREYGSAVLGIVVGMGASSIAGPVAREIYRRDPTGITDSVGEVAGDIIGGISDIFGL